MLDILIYPDDRLRTKAKPVSSIDDEIKKLVDDMAETMYSAPGIGLAATQVGILKRVAVIDIDYMDESPNLIVLINPEIISREGEIVWEEGCLSFPDIHEEVVRSERIRVRALNLEGKPFEIDADGLLSVALQHEIDHLDGNVFIDKLSFLKRRIIQRQMSKQKKTK